MKKLIAGLLAVLMLFALTACGNGGDKADKNLAEVSSTIGRDGKITMGVPKNDDGTPKYDFSETAPEGLQQYIVRNSSLYLSTDKATFAFSIGKLVYNTSTTYKEKYGEQAASFDKYLEWLNNDEEGLNTKSYMEMEELEIGGRKAVRRTLAEGSSSNYEYHGYNYAIAYDDIQEGYYLEMYVAYPNGATEKEAKELDHEVLDMVNSVTLSKAE